MKNQIAIPQATNPKGLLPSITSILESPFQNIFDVFRTFFAKQKGDGDPVTERPKVTSVQVVINPVTSDPTKIILITDKSATQENFDYPVKLIFSGNAFFEIKETPVFNGQLVTYSIPGTPLEDPGVNVVDIDLAHGGVDVNKYFSYTQNIQN